ncbi:aldehyde-activating protein [Acidihalobacter aeolianus]|uniref:Aldehyde-activating protein n=1 Tax=Acidihalobacter aeolianus TaxID=2792603 RepID=A0A1D8K5L6_9GAMM|nr:GFA family protein [Acidihalobacter aeolianus]AOV16248.1 aldehyde-activating protein [Acidihalobacter aeolianus]
MIEGRCACGACRYRIDAAGLDDVAICHCGECRRSTGGTHVTWASVPRAAFQWTGVEPHCYRPASGGERYFCPACGAHLALWTPLAPDTLDVTVSTLDHPERHPPDRHIWVSSRLPWVSLNDGLAQEDEETLPPRESR